MITFIHLDSNEPHTFHRRERFEEFWLKANCQQPVSSDFSEHWDTIAECNARGVYPYVCVCPYASDVGGETDLIIEDTKAEAESAAYEAAMEV